MAALLLAAVSLPSRSSAFPDARPERPAFFSAFADLAPLADAVSCPDRPSETGFAFAYSARPASAVAAVVRIVPGADSLAWADAWAIRRESPGVKRPHSALSTLDPPGVPVPRVVAFRSGWRPFALVTARRNLPW